MAVYLLYVTTQLQLPPALVGVVLGIGSLGGLAGAFIASPAARRFGTGYVLIAATFVSGCAGLTIGINQFVGFGALPVLIGAQIALMLGVPIYNINQLTLRQSITPAG